MKLRVKILLSMCGIFLLMMGGLYIIQQTIVMREFQRLERHAARDDLTRCAEAVRRDLEHLASFSQDWATWDDSAKFIVDNNSEFIKNNLQDDVFKVSNFSLLMFVDLEGQIIWSGARYEDYVTPIEFDFLPKDRFAPSHHLLVGNKPRSDNPQISGIVMTEKGPLLLCARPILNSAGQWPAKGTLIVGRLLGENLLQRYHSQTKIKFEVISVQDAGQHPALREVIKLMPTPNSVLFKESSERITTAFCYLTDPQGKPSLIIKAEIPRDITAQGRRTVQVTIRSLIVLALVAGLALVALITCLVTKPLELLAQKASEIATSGDLTRSIGMKRSDEIGTFANQFDKMVIALGESRAQFMAQSRQAGMAEIATGVLHNIGNAVTNANVIAGTLAEKLSQSKAPSLSKAVAMMTEHKDDLPKFLSEDGRGKKLPAFLEQLAGFLNLEMAQTQDDLNALRDGLQHVKQIVAAQQDFAKGSNVVETIDLNRLVNQTISLMKGSTDKHRITVTLNAQSKLTIDCDRSKLQQILVNLLTNAKDAIRDSHSTVREIRVQLGLGDNGHVFIEIQDSGLGIAPENLNRIFANGFTTKASGHGHGLHHSATAIKEMGGTLRPSSDGPGRGATFRIELPIAVRAQQEITK